MDSSTLCWFFFWCTVINYLILGGMTAAFVLLGDKIFALHRRWFDLDKGTFEVAMYFFLGIYKILVLVFCFVPWIALLIAG
ncbi:MAG: hypothetical protein PHI81_01895 [Synergistaceae bacterium]|jgi:hypothetical protein|uniref:DUF6868 family protein n=1 Tax=Aminivibrio sp. TaxID=1872489 RepID=UPI001D721A22|nr:hypothetical protein [Synergistaceae bacterium]MDD3391632.1 hypothetical protein [Synergistaceae bacterium]MDD3688771.1 hypothetical protein [Synergistaceae bacterium]MDD4612644.1 hypothetical protein [Synergistaceae bacterium]NCC56424.1 hypothetical protein [Synergistales bacterium]